jgi:hypothetical protein
VAPISYVLAASFLYRVVPVKATPFVLGLMAFLAILVWTPGVASLGGNQRLTTPAGAVRVLPEDEKLLKMILGQVRQGDSLFVFPYFPTMYFLTHGVNPTHFSYLQPGLMTLEDEAYLKHWPSSDPSRLRLNSIERFLSSNYRSVERLSHRLGDFSLLERVSSE